MLYRFERLVDVIRRREAAHRRGDLAIRSDNESRALGKTMPDLDAARVLAARLALPHHEVVRLCDRAVRIGGGWKLARAVLRVGREVVEALDAVERHADDRRAGRRKFIAADREGMRLDVAATGVGR